jgi:hypothetical protein
MLNSGHIRIYHISPNPLEVVENEALLFAMFPVSERALLYVRVLRCHPLLKAT